MLCHRHRCRQWRRIGDRSGRRHERRRHGDDNNAVDAVIPPSSTKDEDAYVGGSVAFKRCSHRAAARRVGGVRALLPPRCRRRAVRHRRALVAPLTLQPPTVALRTTAALCLPWPPLQRCPVRALHPRSPRRRRRCAATAVAASPPPMRCHANANAAGRGLNLRWPPFCQ